MQLLSSTLITPIAIALPTFSALLAIFGMLLVQSPIGNARLYGVVTLLAAVVLLAVGLCPRTVWVDEVKREVVFAWGRRWPLVYSRMDKAQWASFAVQKVYWHTVTPRSGGSYNVSSAKERWRLSGMTVKGRAVKLADYVDQAEALRMRDALLNMMGIGPTHFSASFRLGEPMKEDSDVARMYNAMGEWGKWEAMSSTSIYDMPDQSTMSTSQFDIPLLASIAGVKKPWAAIAKLTEDRFIEPFDEQQVVRAVALEQRLPWVDVAVIKRSR